MDESLHQAIEQLKSGDQQGFQILYDQTHNYVYMQARSFLKNEADANDLVQEVYINAYRSIHSLSDNQKIYAWLGAIAFRQATKILRKQKDVLVKEDEPIFETIIDLDMDNQPENALEKKASAQILAELIDELPENQKAALMAYYFDEMSVTDIAEAYGCSTGTIKSRLNYARKSLKESVLEREKRDGIKMYSVSLPLLLLALHWMVETYAMEPSAAAELGKKCADRLGESTGTTTDVDQTSGYTDSGTNAQASYASQAASGAGKFLTAKTVAIMAASAAVIVAVGVGAVVIVSGRMNQEQPVIEEIVETETESVLDTEEVIEQETETEVPETETQEPVVTEQTVEETSVPATPETTPPTSEPSQQTQPGVTQQPQQEAAPTPQEAAPTPTPQEVTPAPAPQEVTPTPTPAPAAEEDEFSLEAPDITVE